MAAPIFIERDMFIHWLNENPQELDNHSNPNAFGNISLEDVPGIINGLIETYCDRDKS